MPKFRRVSSKNRGITIKRKSSSQYRRPRPPMKLGGDAYTGKRHVKREFQENSGFSLEAFCLDCYLQKLMSCQEIRDELEREYGTTVTRQYIWLLLKRYPGILRSQAESMKIRAITGRMDYAETSRHIDYTHRKINYKMIASKRKDKVLETNTKIVELNPSQIEKLRKYAKDNKLTISDAVKIKYYPNSNFKKFIVRLPKRYRQLFYPF